MMTSDEVREARSQLGMNQTEFAELLGTSQVVVSRWENGWAKMSPAYQRIIREKLQGPSGEFTSQKRQKGT